MLSPRLPPPLTLTPSSLSPYYISSTTSTGESMTSFTTMSPSLSFSLASALSLAPRDDDNKQQHFLSLEADVCDSVALEFLSNCVLACGESGMNAGAIAQTTNSVYTLLCNCASNNVGWPSLGSVCDEWDAEMSTILAPNHPESPTPTQMSKFDTWLHRSGFLSPLPFEMHHILWTSGGISVSPPLRRFLRPIVVSPPPVGAYAPLSMARDA